MKCLQSNKAQFCAAAAAARFAEALEVVPRTIAENSGLQATEVLARLYAAHAQGQASNTHCHVLLLSC
jgi:T-complex protein 1 subunit theta